MYQRLLCFFLLLTAVANRTAAQGDASLSGTVQDGAGTALSGASVTLKRGSDSSVVKTAASGPNGRYGFSGLPFGSYFLHVTVVGYSPYTTSVLALGEESRQVTVPLIRLQPSAAPVLGGVTVSATKAMVERKTDRTVVNVEAMLSSTGTTALELLERAPGVSVDENGVVSLNGKAGVLVLIDDKPTYLSGEALANYLRSLPSSSLDKIELMPTPPARYDAAGTAGVINIRTKRSRLTGLNGSASTALNHGKLFSTTNSLNLNYKQGAVSLFGNFSYVRQNGFSDLDIHRSYFTEGGAPFSYFTQNSYIRRNSHAFSGKAGADYAVNKRTTVGVAVNALHRPSYYDINNTSRILNAQKAEDSTTVAHSHERIRWDNQGANLNLKHDLRPSGRTLTADLDYIRYHSPSRQAYYNTTYRASGGAPSSDLLTGYLPSTIDIYASKVDYSHAIGKGLQAEGGAKTSYIRTNNLADYQLTANGHTAPDYEKSNHFLYKEQISAGYLTLSRDGQRFTFKAGLRAEHTLSRGHQMGNVVKPDSAFRRAYTSLFPSLFLSYKLDTLATHQLNLSFGRRIERPFYQDLNPFVTPLDKFTIYAGNPFLKPSFTQEASLAYTYKSKITTTLSYSETKDAFMESIRLIGNHYLSQTANIGSSSILGLSVNAGLRPTKWWTLNVFADVQNRHYEGELFRSRLDTSAVYFGTNVGNQLKLGKTWSAEIGGTYRTGVVVGQVSLASLWQMNAGIQKKVLDGKGSIRGSVRDIFYSGVRNGIIHNLYRAEATFRNQGDLRVFSLSFAYNFGGPASERSRSRGSAQNEQSRVREG
jgi:hypothetical protein